VTDQADPNVLFGTDGVRGVAGSHPLDIPTVTRLGAAIVRALAHNGVPVRPRVLIGRDTRESGAWIERALARGATYEGAMLESAGVIPTPAIAYLTATRGYDLGIVISASHNPYEDNGIKLFDGNGGKLAEGTEREIEAIVADRAFQRSLDEWLETLAAGPAGVVSRVELTDAYLAHVARMLPDHEGLSGMKIAIDCANGATSMAAPRLLDGLGVLKKVIGAEPDGRNINLACGSTHPEQLAAVVLDQQLEMGVAFDGDGDRAIFVTHNGKIVDGDAVLLMCALHRKTLNLLPGDAVVATVMSNIGLERKLAEYGISLVRCPVGDKHVQETMQKHGIALGGEQSGHIIFREHLQTGDGLATALAVLRVIADTGRSLASLASDLVTYPQVLLNVRVREKKPIESDAALVEAIRRVEACLGDEGRLLVRYSGTEPLLRIMIEGRNEQEIRAWAETIAATVKTK